MKKMFLFVPVCALIFSCEKEGKEQIAQSGTSELVSVEQIDLNEPGRPDQNLSGDREGVSKGMIECPMSSAEREAGYTSWTGEKCLDYQYDECKEDANERCKTHTTGVGAIADTYLTPSEIDMFWNKTYDEQFVHDNWDFFMACYNAGEMYHPDEIIVRNFR